MNSIFDQNNNPVYGTYANGMMYGGNPGKDLAWTNALLPEEEKQLHRGSSAISLDIPQEEMFRAKCTHRDPATRTFSVRPNADGTVTCTKCGARFNPVNNVDIEEIKRVIGGTIDILQTIKMAYIDMTPEVIQAYFITLPLLGIAPQMYEAAMHTLDSATPGMGITQNYAPQDAFNSLYSAVGNMGMVNPMMMNAAMYGGQMQGQFMNPPAGSVPYYANPMQTQNVVYQQPGQQAPPAMGQPMAMPGVSQEQAPATASQPQEGQPVQVGKKFKLD